LRGLYWPAELSAWPRAGQSRFAICSDSRCSPRRVFEVISFTNLRGSDFEVAIFNPDGPGDASELVGEGHGGLVVAAETLDVECPEFEAVGSPALFRRPEDGAGAVDKEHADIGITPL
jgi:hypothetical protein